MVAMRLCPGDLLTTDERVQEEFGVSRATARKAIDELADEGLVERITGKGTFVSAPRLRVPLPTMLSFTEEMLRRGLKPSSRVISVSWESPSERAHQALDILDGAKVLRLERIRFADGGPILHSVDELTEAIGIGPDEDFSGSLYTLIETHGVQLGECQNIIEAAITDRRLSQMLKVKIGSPILSVRRTTYDVKGRPILYEDSACRGDLYSYALRLARQPRSAPARRMTR
jgi:GntR family transcriptional regulator